MMADCTGIERLRRVGAQLYGPRWQSRMAKALGVSRHTIWRWITGVHPVPPDIDARLMAITTATAAGAASLTSELASK